MITWLEKTTLKFFLAILPSKWRSQVESRAGFQAVFHSVFHLVSEKGIRLVIGIFTYALVVRHLGPELYGRYSWILNFITIFIPLINYGLDEILTRDFVNAQEDAIQIRKVMWGGIFVRAANALLGIVLMIAVIIYLRPSDTALILMISLYSIAYFLRSFETIDLYYQAKLNIRKLVRARNASYFVVSALKVIGVAAQQFVAFFIFLSGLEYLMGRFFVFLAYRTELKKFPLDLNFPYIKSLFIEAFPQFITVAIFVLNERFPILALGQLSTDFEVGIYNAAAGLLEIWIFIPMAFAASLFPPIVRAHATNPALYHSRSQRFFDLMLWLGIGLAIGVTLFGKWAITLLFGSKYIETMPVLTILVWTQPLMFYHIARVKWFTLEKSLFSLALAAIVTVMLNALFLKMWVPSRGANGAAWAALSSLIIGTIVTMPLSQSLKENFKMLMRSTTFPIRLLLGRE